jgi:deoxyribodipyrimidine photo-lyase
VAATGSSKPYLFNADNVAQFAPEPWHSPGTGIDASYELIEILATNPATVAQANKNELAWDEPVVSAAPPSGLGFAAPDAQVVKGRDVWLVHPWALADMPADLPDDVLVVAVVSQNFLAAHPWNALRWQFVAQRMAAMTPHLWFASDADVAQALAGARSVRTVDHLCLPSVEVWGFERRPAPRLFRHIDKPMDSFSKWWIQVNRNVRHLQQLVYPLPPKAE